MSTFNTVTQKYALDLNVELNHSTVKRLEKYTVHYQKTNKKIKKNHKRHIPIFISVPAQKSTANFSCKIKFSLHFTVYLGAI